MIAVNVFLPAANAFHAAIPGMDTGTSGLPPVMLAGLSAYISSKLAQVKLLKFLAAENPNVFLVSVHPGLDETAVLMKGGAKAEALPVDKGWSSLF